MTATISELDAHEQPSDEMKGKWKSWSRMGPEAFIDNPKIDDPRNSPEEAGFVRDGCITSAQLRDAFSQLGVDPLEEPIEDVPILYHPILPDLLIVPSLVPPAVQMALLDKMLHRDLSNPTHQTNLHLHYDLPYPEGSTTEETSFFSLTPDSTAEFLPKDPSVHKKLSIRQVLQRRLHWVTLGGQYDWTNRVYPEHRPPVFPEDITGFLSALFPETVAQAAIVNFYTPGETMMMHRDVSEFTDKGLVSLSFGCDCLFMIAPNGKKHEAQSAVPNKENLLLRLRSGDAIYMTKDSRYAWHGVPKVLQDTCPAYLENWPASDGKFTEWKDWMKNKRINLNVRQMHD